MTVSTVRAPDHRCSLRDPREGEIVRCEQCGRYWLGHQPPNFEYWRWTRLTRFGAWLRGVR